MAIQWTEVVTLPVEKLSTSYLRVRCLRPALFISIDLPVWTAATVGQAVSSGSRRPCEEVLALAHRDTSHPARPEHYFSVSTYSRAKSVDASSSFGPARVVTLQTRLSASGMARLSATTGDFAPSGRASSFTSSSDAP